MEIDGVPAYEALFRVEQNDRQLLGLWRLVLANSKMYDHAGKRVYHKSGYIMRPGIDFVDRYYEKDCYYNTTKKHLYFAGSRLGMYSSSGDFSYYHQDELDSNRIVTDEDAVQLAEYKYKPFGGTHYSSGSDSSARKFNEKRQEARGSYLRFPARMYDHKRRTWTSADPLAQLSPRIFLTDYTNPYAYCGQDPLNGTDPTGLGWGLDIAGGFADSLENFLVSGIDTLTGGAFSEAMGENFKTYTSENKGGWARGGRISGKGAAVVGAAWMAVSGAYGLAEMVVNGMGGAGGIMVTANGTTAVLALSPPAAVPSLALAKAVLGSVYGTAVCANGAANKGENRSGQNGGGGAGNTSEQSELIKMAKRDKKTGISSGDAKAYHDLGNRVGVKVRGPESHPNRPHGKKPHIHVGPVKHIPVRTKVP
ncbi:MAG: hypothetical protein JRF33_06410 [Deltaproteobacteria bacterium]|nr:hypothetical protein [Deltaproteobacteria bacterium]